MCLESHLKYPIYICLEPETEGHSSIFNPSDPDVIFCSYSRRGGEISPPLEMRFLSADSFSSALLVRLEEDDEDGDGDDFFQKFRKERKN